MHYPALHYSEGLPGGTGGGGGGSSGAGAAKGGGVNNPPNPNCSFKDIKILYASS